MPNDILIALVTVTFLVIVFLWAYLMDRRYLRPGRRASVAHVTYRHGQENLASSGVEKQRLDGNYEKQV